MGCDDDMNRESWREACKVNTNIYRHEDDPPEEKPKYDSKEIAAKAYEQYAEKAKVRDHQKNRDQFWRDVVCSLIQSHNGTVSYRMLCDFANNYLEEYDLRFDPNTGSKVVSS